MSWGDTKAALLEQRDTAIVMRRNAEASCDAALQREREMRAELARAEAKVSQWGEAASEIARWLRSMPYIQARDLGLQDHGDVLTRVADYIERGEWRKRDG